MKMMCNGCMTIFNGLKLTQRKCPIVNCGGKVFLLIEEDSFYNKKYDKLTNEILLYFRKNSMKRLCCSEISKILKRQPSQINPKLKILRENNLIQFENITLKKNIKPRYIYWHMVDGK